MRSQRDAGDTLDTLKPADQSRLVAAMSMIENLLDPRPAELAKPRGNYLLRGPKPGDFGWIVKRHAELYAEEYGWTEPFEGLCAQIVADFVNKYDAKCERCWIAEVDGENVGSIMLVKDARKCRPHPPFAGRSESARARARRAADGRKHPLRPARRLQEDHAMDAFAS